MNDPIFNTRIWTDKKTAGFIKHILEQNFPEACKTMQAYELLLSPKSEIEIRINLSPEQKKKWDEIIEKNMGPINHLTPSKN